MSAPYDVELSDAAIDDIATLFDRSAEMFGIEARSRYDVLVTTALLDIAADPFRPTSQARPDVGPESRVYHLRFSRARAGKSVGVVRAPRHLLVYEISAPGLIHVLRVLHDAMDIVRHVSKTPKDDQT